MATNNALTPSQAVAELKLEPFIQKNREQIAKKLLSVYENAVDQGENAQLVFIAESMPVMSAIIQLGSDPESFDKVIKLIHTRPVRSAPVCILAALVFIYLVDVAFRDIDQGNDSNRAAWLRIRGWVERWQMGQTGGPVLTDATSPGGSSSGPDYG